MTISVKSLEDMFREIKTTLQTGIKGRPAFTLLLGSGFSYPIIPTPSQMLGGDIAWWLYCKSRQVSAPFCHREEAVADGRAKAEDVAEFERELWKPIHAKAAEKKTTRFALGPNGRPDLSDPESVGRAYQAVMRDGLVNNGMRRQYLRDAITRSGRRINSAHLFLASILDAQESEDWPWGAPFCRTIFTTNFDPLLQRSLQLFNKLYFMTDRPDVLEPPDDDESPAIHLVYTHGSVHRYQLLNTDEQIGSAAKRNAASLVNYFQRHGVIVIGYSGWRDTTMEALRACASFDQNLYWCDMHSGRAYESRLRPDVRKLLDAGERNAFYVPIHPGADDAMRRLHESLGLGAVPKFILNPVDAMIEQLNSIQLSSEAASAPADATSAPVPTSMADLLNNSRTRLEVARQAFADPSLVNPSSKETAEEISNAWTAKLMNDAWVAWTTGNVDLAVGLWDSVANAKDAPAQSRALATFNTGVAHRRAGRVEEAKASYSHVLEIADAPEDRRASALLNRGVAHRDSGEVAAAIADYSAVLDIPGASPETRAKALVNRAIVFVKTGRIDEAIADYSAVLAMPDAPPEQRAKAFLNRAAYGAGPYDPAKVADYTAVVEMPGARATTRAKALLNRGMAKGRAGNSDAQISDYSAVITMPGAPAADVASALLNRGVAYENAGHADLAINDYTAVAASPDASAQTKAKALLNRGSLYGRSGNSEEQLVDYSAVIAMTDAPSKQRAKALLRRGRIYIEHNRREAAIEDASAVLQIEDAPPALKRQALHLRAFCYGRVGQHDAALADLEMVLAFPDAGAKSRSSAFLSRGWQRFEKGDVDSLIADSRAALELVPDKHMARANLALGLLLQKQTAEALEEYQKLPPDAERILRSAVEDLEKQLSSRGEIPGANEALALLKNLSEAAAPKSS